MDKIIGQRTINGCYLNKDFLDYELKGALKRLKKSQKI